MRGLHPRQEVTMTGEGHPVHPVGLRHSSLSSHGAAGSLAGANSISRRHVLAGLAVAPLLTGAAGATGVGGPQGELTWGIHTTLAPAWFDPAETQGIITPYMVLYALHDGLMKPMPGQPLAPALAESWSASEDALSFEFVLRKGAKFHNGEEVTAEDV